MYICFSAGTLCVQTCIFNPCMFRLTSVALTQFLHLTWICGTFLNNSHLFCALCFCFFFLLLLLDCFRIDLSLCDGLIVPKVIPVNFSGKTVETLAQSTSNHLTMKSKEHIFNLQLETWGLVKVGYMSSTRWHSKIYAERQALYYHKWFNISLWLTINIYRGIKNMNEKWGWNIGKTARWTVYIWSTNDFS